MKNLIFLTTILLGSMLCSCDGRPTTTADPAVDSVEVVTDSVLTDSVTVDTVSVDTVQ